MSRSKVKVTRDKNELMHSEACAVRCTQQKTIPLRRSRGVTVACVWCMFGKTSLALVGSSFIGMSSNIMHDIVTAGLLAKNMDASTLLLPTATWVVPDKLSKWVPR